MISSDSSSSMGRWHAFPPGSSAVVSKLETKAHRGAKRRSASKAARGVFVGQPLATCALPRQTRPEPWSPQLLFDA